jgi:hypothetical protein
MQSAAQAYGKIAKQVASPRELEASLLLKAASRLQAIQDGWDKTRPELDEALRYNRKLWTIFTTSITAPDHTDSGGLIPTPADCFMALPRPPVEQCAGADHVALFHQCDAALADGLVEVLDGVEVGVGERFIDELP